MSSNRNTGGAGAAFRPLAGTGRVSVLFLLSPCNIDCPFCITEDGVDQLSFPEAVSALERMRADGVGNVVLGGGEPLLWPHDVFRLAGKAKEMGFFVQLGTNGIRLPDGFETRTEVDRYVLPLESADPETNDSLRPWRESHFALVLDRLGRLRDSRKPTTISTVVTRPNHVGLPALSRLLTSLDPDGEWIHAWHLYRFLPFGRGGAVHSPALMVTREEYDAACRPVKEAGLPFRVYKRPDMRKAKTVDFHWLESGEPRTWFRGRLIPSKKDVRSRT